MAVMLHRREVEGLCVNIGHSFKAKSLVKVSIVTFGSMLV